MPPHSHLHAGWTPDCLANRNMLARCDRHNPGPAGPAPAKDAEHYPAARSWSAPIAPATRFRPIQPLDRPYRPRCETAKFPNEAVRRPQDITKTRLASKHTEGTAALILVRVGSLGPIGSSGDQRARKLCSPTIATPACTRLRTEPTSAVASVSRSSHRTRTTPTWTNAPTHTAHDHRWTSEAWNTTTNTPSQPGEKGWGGSARTGSHCGIQNGTQARGRNSARPVEHSQPIAPRGPQLYRR